MNTYGSISSSGGVESIERQFSIAQDCAPSTGFEIHLVEDGVVPRVAVYCYGAAKDLELQVETGKAFALRHFGLESVQCFAEAKPSRSAFAELLEGVRAKAYTVVIVRDVDRFSRELGDQLDVLSQFLASDVKVVTTDGVDVFEQEPQWTKFRTRDQAALIQELRYVHSTRTRQGIAWAKARRHAGSAERPAQPHE